jgi:hypothetical protein
MRALYSLRSKIVHSGAPNLAKEEDVLELRNYVRRAIKESYEINREKKELNEMLNKCGFGEKPWKPWIC